MKRHGIIRPTRPAGTLPRSEVTLGGTSFRPLRTLKALPKRFSNARNSGFPLPLLYVLACGYFGHAFVMRCVALFVALPAGRRYFAMLPWAELATRRYARPCCAQWGMLTILRAVPRLLVASGTPGVTPPMDPQPGDPACFWRRRR